MIEALIAYIESKGFRVAVFPAMLLISKGDFWIAWEISQEDLQSRRSLESFYEEADIKMAGLAERDSLKRLNEV